MHAAVATVAGKVELYVVGTRSREHTTKKKSGPTRESSAFSPLNSALSRPTVKGRFQAFLRTF